ncbi:MAG: glycosyltransferase family 4 protein [Dehalococcoidia bacterium]|nr:glycosyltransferase family 4 protein [Dehalococcoidia bacterium]
MNICFVLLSGEWGGAETAVYELARHLRAKGESVSIVLNRETYEQYSDLEGVRLLSIGALYPPDSAFSFLLKVGRGRSLLSRALSLPSPYLDEIARRLCLRKTRREVVQWLSNDHTDIVSPILEDSVPLVSRMAHELKTLRIAAIAMVAGEGNLRGTEPVHPLLRPIAKWKAREFRKALQKMDKVIGPSAFMLPAWEAQGASLAGRYAVIPNGVNLSDIQRSMGSALKLKGRFNLLFPGGAKFIKGGDLVVRALPAVRKEIPEFHLYVAWDVPHDHRIRRMVADMGLDDSVSFVGFLNKDEYRRLLSSVDALVMPSRDEAFGIVFLEAMALGKPVVASSAGGIPEVVRDGRNGILVRPDPDQIASAIVRLYRDEGLRTEMSQNNLQDVTKYDWSRIVDEFMRVYREVSMERQRG